MPQAIRHPRNFAVLQTGARMSYAVPAFLARNNSLKAFYTDLHGSHLPFKILEKYLPPPLQTRGIKRLLGRQLPLEIPRRFVRDEPLFTLLNKHNSLKIDSIVLNRAKRENFGGANSLYTNFINNDIDTILYAKELGLYVVHELMITADSGRIMLEENNRYPGIEESIYNQEEVEAGIEKDQQKWKICDKVLVPSKYCLNTTIGLGCNSSKIDLVPYGIKEEWLSYKTNPIPGRILFVGQVGLRKGNHYLAEACRILRSKNINFECRVVGPITVDINNPIFEGPNYLGQIPRSIISEEFKSADIFVLPTLAEGSGIVHLEAMACGLPVVTTSNCGSIIKDGFDGFIVPTRNANKLAEKIRDLIEDRDLRNKIGNQARISASSYGWNNYCSRLLHSLGI